MGISAYKMRYRYDTYTMYGMTSYSTGHPVSLFTQHTTGATLNVGRPLGNTFWRLGASYTYQSIGIGGIASGYESFALGQLGGEHSERRHPEGTKRDHPERNNAEPFVQHDEQLLYADPRQEV